MTALALGMLVRLLGGVGGGRRLLRRMGSLLSFALRSGAVMARHRRPVSATPAELLVFRGDDWIGSDGVPPFEAWLKARFEWSKAHPDDFSLGGDVLDMLRERRAYRRGLLP